MSVLAYVPRRPAIIEAASQTGLLLALRWRLVRGKKSRAFVLFGLITLIAALFVVSSAGLAVRTIAEQGGDSAAALFATNYVIALQRGDLGTVGASALGTALAAALFSPFTGAANLALAAGDDLSGLRPQRLHRYFDSVITAGVSTVGFLQIFSLTAVASLLTLDGGRVGGLLFTWALWPALIMASVAEGWAIELLHRRAGTWPRRMLALTLILILAAAISLDPQHGQTLFGVGTAYSNTLRAAGAGNIGYIAGAFAVLAVVIIVLFIAGMTLSQAALTAPAVPIAAPKKRRPRRALSTRPKVALFQVLMKQMIRTAEVRRPVVTILIIGVPAAWLSGSVPATMTTLVIAVPLAVALAWGVNTFGILGSGMTWLASQPNALRSLLPLIVGLQVATTLTIATLCWLPPTLVGQVPIGDAVAVAAATVVSTAITSRSAASKAVRRPFLARLGSRGDVLVPPLTAINYTLRFALWGGQLGVLTLSAGSVAVQAGAAALAVALAAGRFKWLLKTWNNRENQARVVAAVSAA